MNKEFTIGEPPKQIVVAGKLSFSTKKIDIINLDIINDLVKENAYVYWQCAKFVDFGLFENGEIILNNKSDKEKDFGRIQELRIFNETLELHFWKQNNNIKYRLIDEEHEIKKEVIEVINDFNKVTDGDYEQVAITQKVKLWGNKIEPKNGFSILSEDRGMKINVPFVLDKMPKDHESIFIKEHRYICYDDLNLAYFIDRRLCGFYISDEGGFKKC